MKKKFKFWTVIGSATNYYDVLDNGQIIRRDGQFGPSEQWRFTGICASKAPKGHPVSLSFDNITKEIVDTLSLSYDNGQPRYFPMDFDHGSYRTWGEGIKGFYFYKENER